MQLKICPRSSCEFGGKPQPIENFHISRTRPDGRQAYCKSCFRVSRRERYAYKSMAVRLSFADNPQDLERYMEIAKLEGRTVDEQLMAVLLENLPVRRAF